MVVIRQWSACAGFLGFFLASIYLKGIQETNLKALLFIKPESAWASPIILCEVWSLIFSQVFKMGVEWGFQALSIISWSRWLLFPIEGFLPSEILEVCTSSCLTPPSLCNRRLVWQVCKDVSSPPAMIKETSASPFNSCQSVYLPRGWSSIWVLPQKPSRTCSSLVWHCQILPPAVQGYERGKVLLSFVCFTEEQQPRFS